MWDLISFMFALGVLLLILHYWVDPAQVIKDIKAVVGSHSRISKLERRVAELEKQVQEQKPQSTSTS